MVALVVDPIDQGERGQYLGKGGWPELWGTGALAGGHRQHAPGPQYGRFEIWDDMRAIDYLQSRPEVDPQRIGCTGNSGGGTQTSYMMALDDRIRAAAPSCYLCGFPALLSTIGPQDAEQNIFGQLAFGMDHADYIMMRAPSAGADVYGHQGLLRYPRGLGRLPPCQASLHPDGLPERVRHPRERRRAQLRQAATRRRRPLVGAVAAARTSR